MRPPAPSDRHAHDRAGPARQVAHAAARKEKLSPLHPARRRPQRRPSIGHSETHLKDRVGHRIRRTSRAVRGRGMSKMRTNRSSTSAPSRRRQRRSTLASPTGARRLMRAIREHRSAGVVGALIVSAALSLFLTGCGHHPKTAVQGEHGMFVMDDFESGALTGWKAVGGGSGGWFIYTDGSKAPDPARSDPNVPFDLPNPPQGRFAAVTDANGPGTRILYRDVKLDGRFRLHLSVFYAGVGGFSSPQTLAYDEPGANQQFRIDLVAPSAPIDSVAHRRCPGEHLCDRARRSGPSRAEHRQRRRVALGGPDGAPASRRYRQRRSTARRRGRHPLRADRRERRTPGSSFRPPSSRHAP